jgi:hypothetical protein
MRHQAEADALGEISGHYHPKTHIDVRGRRLSGACFVHDERRVVLPAFGTYTAACISRAKRSARSSPRASASISYCAVD